MKGTYACVLMKNLNTSRPSEHPPVSGKNAKTFRWEKCKLRVRSSVSPASGCFHFSFVRPSDRYGMLHLRMVNKGGRYVDDSALTGLVASSIPHSAYTFNMPTSYQW